MDQLKNNLNDSLIAKICMENGNAERFSLLPDPVYLNVISKVHPPKKRLIKIEGIRRSKNMAICVIVKDIDEKKPEETIDYFKNKLRQELSENNLLLPKITFLPLVELKLSYQSYDAKRRLYSSFDIFMVDKRIAHRVTTKLGKKFYSDMSSKLPVYCNVEKKTISDEISKAFNSQNIVVCENGSCSSQHIGYTDMSISDLKHNVLEMAKLIFKKWPGKINNIRSLYLQAKKCSLPIYFDNTSAPEELVLDNLIISTNVCKGLKKLSKSSKVRIYSSDRVGLVNKLAKGNKKLAEKANVYKDLCKSLKSSKKSTCFKTIPEESLRAIMIDLPNIRKTKINSKKHEINF